MRRAQGQGRVLAVRQSRQLAQVLQKRLQQRLRCLRQAARPPHMLQLGPPLRRYNPRAGQRASKELQKQQRAPAAPRLRLLLSQPQRHGWEPLRGGTPGRWGQPGGPTRPSGGWLSSPARHRRAVQVRRSLRRSPGRARARSRRPPDWELRAQQRRGRPLRMRRRCLGAAQPPETPRSWRRCRCRARRPARPRVRPFAVSRELDSTSICIKAQATCIAGFWPRRFVAQSVQESTAACRMTVKI